MKRFFLFGFFLLNCPMLLMAEIELEDLAKSNLPQLNTETYASQLFWLFIFFFIFYSLVAWVFIPRIQKLLAYRQRHIQNLLEEAEIMVLHAEDDAKKAALLLEGARNEARAHIEKEKKILEKTARKHIRAFEENLNKKTALTLSKITEEKLRSTLTIETNASKLAAQIIKKIAIHNHDAPSKHIDALIRKHVDVAREFVG